MDPSNSLCSLSGAETKAASADTASSVTSSPSPEPPRPYRQHPGTDHDPGRSASGADEEDEDYNDEDSFNEDEDYDINERNNRDGGGGGRNQRRYLSDKERGSRSNSPSGSASGSSQHSEEGSRDRQDQRKPPAGFPPNIPSYLWKNISLSGASVAPKASAPARVEPVSSEDYAQNWLRKHQQQQQQQLQRLRNDQSEDEEFDREEDEEEYGQEGDSKKGQLTQQQKQEELIRQIKLKQKESEKQQKEKEQFSTNQILLKYSSISFSNAGSNSSSAKDTKEPSSSSVSVSGLPKLLGSSISFSKPGSSSDATSKLLANSSLSISGASSSVSLPKGCSVSFAQAEPQSDYSGSDYSDSDDPEAGHGVHPTSLAVAAGASITFAKVSSCGSEEIPKSFGSSISISNASSVSNSTKSHTVSSANAVVSSVNDGVASLPKSLIGSSITFTKQGVSAEDNHSRGSASNSLPGSGNSSNRSSRSASPAECLPLGGVSIAPASAGASVTTSLDTAKLLRGLVGASVTFASNRRGSSEGSPKPTVSVPSSQETTNKGEQAASSSVASLLSARGVVTSVVSSGASSSASSPPTSGASTPVSVQGKDSPFLGFTKTPGSEGAANDKTAPSTVGPGGGVAEARVVPAGPAHRRCQVCNEVFDNGSKLRLHILSSHSAVKSARAVTPPFSAEQPSSNSKKSVQLTQKRTETKSVETILKPKPRPFKLLHRCRKCSVKKFPDYHVFKKHHLQHIAAVKVSVQLQKLSNEQLKRYNIILESAKKKKAATGRKRGRKPGIKKNSNYDDDRDFTPANLKLKLKLSGTREGSGRTKRRASIVNAGMSALLEDSDAEGFEGEFGDLPDIPSLPPADPSERRDGEKENGGDDHQEEQVEEEQQQHCDTDAHEDRDDQVQNQQQDHEDFEQDPGLEDSGQHEIGDGNEQDREEQEEHHQQMDSMTPGQMSASDEGYDDDPDDPDAVGGNGEIRRDEREALHEENSNDTGLVEGSSNASEGGDQETTFRGVEDPNGDKQAEPSQESAERRNEFDNAFNNPANLGFDSESEHDRPPSTYQPQFESFTGDWFQEYESGPRIAAAMAGSSSSEENRTDGGEWPSTQSVASSGQDTHLTQSGDAGGARQGEQSGLFSQEILGNESSNNNPQQSGGSFEQLCLNDTFNQDQVNPRSNESQEGSREGQGENGPRDLLSELEYLNRGGQSTGDVGQSGSDSGRDGSQHSLSRPGSNSSGQSGGHPTPPPDTFRALATSPLTSPTSPSMGGGRPATTTSPMQGVSPAQSTSPHLAGASHMVGSPHMAGSPHMVGSPHMTAGSPHQMTGSPHLSGSPHPLSGSPHLTGSPQASVQQPTEARLTIANNLMASSASANGNLPSGNLLSASTYQQWSGVATTSSYGTSNYMGSNGLGTSMRPPMPPGVSVPYRPSPPPRVRGRPPLMGHSTRPPTMRGPGRPSGSSILPPPLMPAPGGRGSGIMPSLQRLPGYNSQGRQMQQMTGQKRPLSGGQQTGMSPSKSRREDINVPSRQKDNECQIIAVNNRSDGLPVISNVQGGRDERRSSSANNTSSSAGGGAAGGAGGESTIHLSDSITLSVRSSAANKEPARGERSGDAGTVANLLASRGITVTPAAGEKGNEGVGGREERRIPTASDLNLSSAISVHPPTSRDRDGFAVPQAPSSRTSSSSSREVERPPRPPTVDLTHDVSPTGSQATRIKCSQCDRTFPNQSLLADHAKVHQQAQSSRMPYKCHLCTAGFSTQKGQQHHYQQFHQLHLSTNDVAIPVVDLRNPMNVQRMAALGVRSFLPLSNLQNRGGGGIVGIPLLTLENLRNGQMTLQQWGISDVLTLGPAKTLNVPR